MSADDPGMVDGPCGFLLGALPCDNPDPHRGDGRGCTHTHGWAYDRHDKPGRGDGE